MLNVLKTLRDWENLPKSFYNPVYYPTIAISHPLPTFFCFIQNKFDYIPWIN